MSQKDLIDQAFTKWSARLGLNWWTLEMHFYDDPGEIVRLFRQMDSGDVVAAFVDANWMYGTAKISINLPAFDDMTPKQVEEIIVHELCHILVNEMREGELHHEERVVTGLTKAFFWVESFTTEEATAFEPELSLAQIVAQLKLCGYECEGGKLEDNAAFKALERLAKETVC